MCSTLLAPRQRLDRVTMAERHGVRALWTGKRPCGHDAGDEGGSRESNSKPFRQRRRLASRSLPPEMGEGGHAATMSPIQTTLIPGRLGRRGCPKYSCRPSGIFTDGGVG